MSVALKSVVLDERGERAISTTTWEPPKGSHPFFGWMGDEGFTTLRLEDIQAVTPHPQLRGRMIVFMRAGLQVFVNGADGERLLRRLGWTGGNAT